MVEFRRDKILPEDLIQRTNLQQHNFMIDAINDIDGRQVDIEHITNINIDDIVDLKTDVIALSNEKLDKEDIDADLHFGDITVTREGTAVIMSLDVLNPTTGITTPISFTIPGATDAQAGVMDASSMAWITEADDRISALEGLSDVKAVADLPGTPTQAQLNAGWAAAAGKTPETGDILQDINNSKLWVFVSHDWVLYGSLVIVPIATTSTIGGVRDTSLTAEGNRWYVHVEADGRLALIGGDSLSTVVDTTIPAMQSALDNTVRLTGNQTIAGHKTFTNPITTSSSGEATFRAISVHSNEKNNITGWRRFFRITPECQEGGMRGIEYTADATASAWSFYNTRWVDGIKIEKSALILGITNNGDTYVAGGMRPSPANTDIVNKGYLDTRLSAKQDTLTFDNAPVSGSANPVKSGGVYSALAGKVDTPEWTYGSGTLTTNNGTCGYNYAYYTIGDVVTIRFTVGASVDTQFTVPLPVSVGSASVQCMGISDNASFWVDYNGTATSTITVNRAQTTTQERSFHMLVIGQPSN